MVQETNNINKELIAKIVRLQLELDEIKSQMGISQLSLKEEMKAWEESSTEDSADFFEKYNL